MPTYELNRRHAEGEDRLRVRAVDDQAARVRRHDGVLGPQARVVHADGGPRAGTERIKLYASTATLTLPPAIVARMAMTIDSMAPGRFGVNIVSGWQKGEYAQMGLWPGDEHVGDRYEQSARVRARPARPVGDRRSDLDGEFFHMEDCRLVARPRPGTSSIVCAGQATAGAARAVGDGASSSPRRTREVRRSEHARRDARHRRDVGADVCSWDRARPTRRPARETSGSCRPPPRSTCRPTSSTGRSR